MEDLIETIENRGFSLAIHGVRSAVLMTRTLEYSPILEMCARVKMLGYTTAGRVRLYGEELEIVSEPFPEANGIAVRAKSSKVPEIYPKLSRSGSLRPGVRWRAASTILVAGLRDRECDARPSGA